MIAAIHRTLLNDPSFSSPPAPVRGVQQTPSSFRDRNKYKQSGCVFLFRCPNGGQRSCPNQEGSKRLSAPLPLSNTGAAVEDWLAGRKCRCRTNASCCSVAQHAIGLPTWTLHIRQKVGIFEIFFTASQSRPNGKSKQKHKTATERHIL